MKIPLLFHLLGAVVWVGGMFFAYLALRPAAAKVLEAPQRLSLWRETLKRFFLWVWIAIIALFVSGAHMLTTAFGFRSVPTYVVAMISIATVMAVIFAYVYFQSFSALGRAVDAEDWRAGGAALNRIRKLVAINLLLGLATVAVAVMGGLLG